MCFFLSRLSGLTYSLPWHWELLPSLKKSTTEGGIRTHSSGSMGIWHLGSQPPGAELKTNSESSPSCVFNYLLCAKRNILFRLFEPVVGERIERRKETILKRLHLIIYSIIKFSGVFHNLFYSILMQLSIENESFLKRGKNVDISHSYT